MMEDENLKIISDFLVIFYYEEPSDDVAATNALYYYGVDSRDEERTKVANTFKSILKSTYPDGTFLDIVRKCANRHAQDEKQAIGFIKKVYLDNAFDVFNDIDD